MSQKTRVAVLFGGRSAEHEVSLQSARNVINAIDRDKYDTVLIGIDRDGAWYLNQDSMSLLNADDPRLISMNQGNNQISRRHSFSNLICLDHIGIIRPM